MLTLRQNALIVGDYLRYNKLLIKYAQQAADVIKWFNSHTRPLEWLCEEQHTKSKHVLALLVAVVTSWTTHYLSMHRLLQLGRALQALVDWDPERLIEAVGPKD